MRDDGADRELFESVFGWMETGDPHASVVMLPSGQLFGRAMWPGHYWEPLDLISVAGDDLKFWLPESDDEETATALIRNEQAFGRGTMRLLRRLRIGVVGCSGTGSPVVEQLARLGVGVLVLVDPQCVEEKNLNRILNSTWRDAVEETKVDVLRRAIESMGLGTRVITYQNHWVGPTLSENSPAATYFGSHGWFDGRQLLNRLATFYSIPYFDVGVRLIADGQGGVSHICGSVNYLQPDGSSLMSRGLFTEEQVRAEALRREAPEQFERLRGEGYIAGVDEERPAVLPVNMLFASLAVNEFLRVHDYRHEPNANYARLMLSLEQVQFYPEQDGGMLGLARRGARRGAAARPSCSSER